MRRVQARAAEVVGRRTDRRTESRSRRSRRRERVVIQRDRLGLTLRRESGTGGSRSAYLSDRIIRGREIVGKTGQTSRRGTEALERGRIRRRRRGAIIRKRGALRLICVRVRSDVRLSRAEFGGHRALLDGVELIRGVRLSRKRIRDGRVVLRRVLSGDRVVLSRRGIRNERVLLNRRVLRRAPTNAMRKT